MKAFLHNPSVAAACLPCYGSLQVRPAGGEGGGVGSVTALMESLFTHLVNFETLNAHGLQQPNWLCAGSTLAAG